MPSEIRVAAAMVKGDRWQLNERRKVMTVGELKEILSNLPPKARLVVYSEDESIHLPNVFVKKVLLKDYTEANLGMLLEFVI